MIQRKQSLLVSIPFTIFEYFTLVAFAFLHFSAGRWTFRTPTVYSGTITLWVGVFLWASWRFWFIDALNVLIELIPFGSLSEIPYEALQTPQWLWWWCISIPAAFAIQHYYLSGGFEDEDDIYTGYPIILFIFRLITGRKPITRHKEEERIFKEYIEPLLVFGFSFIWIEKPFFFWIGILMGIFLFARERMLKHFYEVNRVNTQDVIIRAEEIAAGAGMQLASKQKGKPITGKINPSLLNRAKKRQNGQPVMVKEDKAEQEEKADGPNPYAYSNSKK